MKPLAAKQLNSKMFIILDYDETYTADPALWDKFIALAKNLGHEIICCTMRMEGERYDNEDVITDMAKHSIDIIYAASYKDKWEAVQEAGFVPENAIWIDDRPMYIFLNRLPNELPD